MSKTDEKRTKKFPLTTFLLLAVVVTLMITKPNEQDFEDHIIQDLEVNTETRLDKWAAKLGNSIAGKTETRDYLLFTVHKYQVLDQRATYLGILGDFYEI